MTVLCLGELSLYHLLTSQHMKQKSDTVKMNSKENHTQGKHLVGFTTTLRYQFTHSVTKHRRKVLHKRQQGYGPLKTVPNPWNSQGSVLNLIVKACASHSVSLLCCFASVSTKNNLTSISL